MYIGLCQRHDILCGQGLVDDQIRLLLMSMSLDSMMVRGFVQLGPLLTTRAEILISL